MTEYTITSLGHLGDGLIRADSTDLVAPFTLPDEVVTGLPDQGQLTQIRIQTPSARRIKPACKHFKKCGGCKLQHADDALVAEWKTDQLRKALRHWELDTEFLSAHVSPPHSRRRASFTAKRTKSGIMLGFLAPASDTLIAIEECHVVDPKILAQFVGLKALGGFAVSRKSSARLSVTLSLAGLDINVESTIELTPENRMKLGALAEAQKFARITWNGEDVALRARPEQEFDGIRVTPPPGSFLQATKDAERAMQSAVGTALSGASRVLDFFCGCGTFALPLAKSAEVHAFEADAAMIQSLESAWREATDLHALTAVKRDLFRRPLLAQELKGFDAAVIDPPRAGASAQIAEIAKSDLSKLAHVSCNPSTFARDARVLVDAGFTLKTIQLIDQFRWSNHIELVAVFTR